MPWPSQGLRRVSINSFGFGGSNGHIIIDDAYHVLEALAVRGLHQVALVPAMPVPDGIATPRRSIEGDGCEPEHEQTSSCPRILTFSAKDEAGLKRVLDRHAAYYSQVISGSRNRIERLAHVLASRRSLMTWRAFAIPDRNAIANVEFSTPLRSAREVGATLIFTGQGAQYASMGLELVGYPVFKNILDEASNILRELGADWDLYGRLG
jgi:acyl transferase domain-containing protein